MNRTTIKGSLLLPAVLLGLGILSLGCDDSPTETQVSNGITSPAAGQNFLLGDSVTVAWNSDELQATDLVSIKLILADTTIADTTITIAEGVPAITGTNMGEFTFFAFDSLVWEWDSLSMEYTVAVENQDKAVSYESEGPVSFSWGILKPDGSRTYNVGDTLKVSWVWNYYQMWDDGAVLFFSNDGRTWESIVPFGQGFDDQYRGTFEWVIPASKGGLATTVGDSCKIKAGGYSGGEFFFYSPPFTVLPAGQ
jgi:hypothetical protein